MQIYIDGTPLLRKMDGIGRYASSLTEALLELDDSNKYTAIGFAGEQRRPHLVDKKKLRYRYLPLPRKAYMASFKKLRPLRVNRLLRPKPDVIIYPNFTMMPKVSGVKTIAVIHDLAFMDVPDSLQNKNLAYLKTFVPRTIAAADTLVAVSEPTREAIAKHFGINISKISVVPNAVGDLFFHKAKPEKLTEVQARYCLPSKFILFVGTIEPRKNISGLLDAYAKLSPALRNMYPLVITGSRRWKNRDIDKRIHQLMDAGNTVLTTGFIDDEDLPAVYQSATLFVLPSFHEGFGIPILEAFASQLPVITSDIEPMRSISGKAALLVDPESPDSIATGLKKLLSNSQARTVLARRGLEVAKNYTWSSSAREMLKIIESLNDG